MYLRTAYVQANKVLKSIDLGVRQTRLIRWIRLPPVNVVNSGKIFITSGCFVISKMEEVLVIYLPGLL